MNEVSQSTLCLTVTDRPNENELLTKLLESQSRVN
jgi:hypothetical protein